MKSFLSFVIICLLFGLATTSALAQQLQCKPCWYGFGKVQTGSSSSFSIELKNTGDKPLEITSDSVQGSAFSVGTFPLPVTLNRGARIQLPVIFTPTAQGRVSGNITLANTGEDPQLIVKIAGTGVEQTSHNVSLSWQPGDGQAVGYNLYRSTTNGGPYRKINSALDASTNYTDYTVESGLTYYYVATEVNAQGEESSYSNVAEAVIP